MKSELLAGLLPSRDLRFPDWGPYSKRYAGISHIADASRGYRFDLSVFPSLYRRRIAPPHVLWEGDERPWEAAPDLSYYTYRHLLEDGRIRGDCAFYGDAPDRREIRVSLTNRSRLSQGLTLNLVAACMPPEFNSRQSSIWTSAVAHVPANAQWQDALNFAYLHYRKPVVWDACMPDGLLRGEMRTSGSVGGSVLGAGSFGLEAGDQVDYDWNLDAPIVGATLAIRYRTPGDTPAVFDSRGLYNGRLVLPPSDSFTVHLLTVGDCAAGSVAWQLCSTGAGAVELDGYVLGPDAAVRQTVFADEHWDPAPRIDTGPVTNSRILTYPGVTPCYGLRWDAPESRVRELLCRDLHSDLLRPWDYFYNSGGWDDYPAQQYVRQQGWQAHVTPVITTAQAIRMAKILEDAAEELGASDDVAAYRRDIERFSRALHQHAWDPKSGYFSYVVHDDAGHARKILRHPNGENYNRGLDGVHPLVADVCDAEQSRALCDNLFDPSGLWTPVGLTTVDRRAVYYRTDGYWNGAVWFPHQWFVWKAMLDQNRVEAAVQIACTALTVWKRETDASGCCYEHFPVETGRGGGWHAFSGLSCPVLAWFHALYQPGRLTVGLNTGIDAMTSDSHRISARLRLKGTAGRTSAVLAVLDTAGTVRAQWNDGEIPVRVVRPGLVAIALSARGRGELTVRATSGKPSAACPPV